MEYMMHDGESLNQDITNIHGIYGAWWWIIKQHIIIYMEYIVHDGESLNQNIIIYMEYMVHDGDH